MVDNVLIGDSVVPNGTAVGIALTYKGVVGNDLTGNGVDGNGEIGTDLVGDGPTGVTGDGVTGDEFSEV